MVIADITIMNNVDDMLLAQQLKTVQEVEMSHGLICGIPNGVESGGKKRVKDRRCLINMSTTQKMIKKNTPHRYYFMMSSSSYFTHTKPPYLIGNKYGLTTKIFKQTYLQQTNDL